MNGPEFAKYTRRIAYYRDAVVTSDGAGGTTAAASVLITQLWASVKPLKGNRVLEYEKIGIKYPHEFEHYYRGDVELRESDWIEYRGKRFTIHSIVNDLEEDWKWIVVAYQTGTVTPEEEAFRLSQDGTVRILQG